MARIAIAQLHDGDSVDQYFVLMNKQIATTSTGKPYIKAECSDATGSLNMRLWNATRELYDSLKSPGYAHVRGRVECYQGHLQMVADEIRTIEDASKIDLSELLKHTKKNVPEMFAKIKSILAGIKDKELALLIEMFLNDADLMKKFCISPAAVGMHHAWIGGLLEHTLSLMELATAICPHYPDIDSDLVYASLFLHDLGKTAELSYACGFDYTDTGRLVGHIVLGSIWIAEKAKEAETKLGRPLRRDLVMVLQHILLSHHGIPEFGAAVLPKTPEAILVNLLDNLDAKTQMALDAVADPTENENWTEFHRGFNTKLFRPSITIREE